MLFLDGMWSSQPTAPGWPSCPVHGSPGSRGHRLAPPGPGCTDNGCRGRPTTRSEMRSDSLPPRCDLSFGVAAVERQLIWPPRPRARQCRWFMASGAKSPCGHPGAIAGYARPSSSIRCARSRNVSRIRARELAAACPIGATMTNRPFVASTIYGGGRGFPRGS